MECGTGSGLRHGVGVGKARGEGLCGSQPSACFQSWRAGQNCPSSPPPPPLLLRQKQGLACGVQPGGVEAASQKALPLGTMPVCWGATQTAPWSRQPGMPNTTTSGLPGRRQRPHVRCLHTYNIQPSFKTRGAQWGHLPATQDPPRPFPGPPFLGWGGQKKTGFVW